MILRSGSLLRAVLLAGLLSSVLVSADGLASTPKTIFDFEADRQGWEPGKNVSSVDSVDSYANNPSTAFHGKRVLEAVMGKCIEPCVFPTGHEVDDPRSTGAPSDDHTVTWSGRPLNLSKCTVMTLHFNSYGVIYTGGMADPQQVVTVTLGSGKRQLVTVDRTSHPNGWTTISIDLSRWSGRQAITAITVNYSIPSIPFYRWSGGFQVDFVTAA